MDLFATAILVLISITIGFLLNALVASLRKKPAEGAQEQILPPAPGPEEAVRLWDDSQTQKMRVEIGGKVFHSPGELDEAQRARLARFAGDLGRWSSGSVETVKAVGSPAQGSTSQAVPTSTPTAASHKAPPKPVQDVPEGLDPNPFKIFTRVFQPNPKTVGETELESIVAQIDTLLQAKLEGTQLASRSIRLVENPGQGISVQVGAASYETIEDVPDPEVRAAIRQAVADWEAEMGN